MENLKECQETHKTNSTSECKKLELHSNSLVPEGIFQYRSIIFNNLLIIFSHTGMSNLLKNTSKLWIFDLDKSQWTLPNTEGGSFLLENSEGYSACIDGKNDIILFGGREGVAAPQTNNREGGILPGRRQHGIFTMNQREVSKHMEKLVILSSEEMAWEQIPLSSSAPFRKFHSANIYNNKLYVFGGKDQEGRACGQLYICDLETNSWLQFHPNEKAPSSRYEHTNVLHLGNIYIFGGSDDDKNCYNDLWALNLYRMCWQKITPSKGLFPIPRSGASAQPIGDKIYMFGGQGHAEFQDIFVYRIHDHCWETAIIKEGLPIRGKNPTFVSYKDKFILGQGNDLYSLQLGESLNEEAEGNKDQSFHSNMRHFYEEKPYSDIIFKVEDKEIPAHKGFLASRCTLFSKMFSSGMKETQSNIIDIPETKAIVFEKLLEFLYCNEVKLDQDIALSLLKLSEEYSLPLLKKKCAEFLAKELTVFNVIEMANAADLYGSEELIEASLDFIFRFKEAVCHENDISKLSKTILVELFLRK